jgi:hypothetical protein
MILAGSAAFSSSVSSQGAQRGATPPPATPIASLAWLVGGTWTAVVSPPGGGETRIETRYQWSDNSAYIRFTTHFTSGKGTLRNYDGNFFWNPDQSALAMWYTDAKGHITQGPVTVSGDTMAMTFRGTDFEGKDADLRATVTRRTNDEYSWLLEEKQPGAWKQLLALTYRRAAGP